jgi:hypothetical protein
MLFLPLLFLFILALVGTGLAFATGLQLEGVAREAARLPSKSTGGGNVELGLQRGLEVARQYRLDRDRLEITVQGVRDDLTPARGGRVVVVVKYRYRVFGLFEVPLAARDIQVIECWRTRDDSSSGGRCEQPGEL